MGLHSYLFFSALCFDVLQQVCPLAALGCSRPRLPAHLDIDRTHLKSPDGEEHYPEGSVVRFACDDGYSLLGSENTTCSAGKWLEHDAKCLLEVAGGSRCYTNSQADGFASAHLAADRDPRTCVSFSTNEKRLVWSVDTIQAFRVSVVRILSQYSLPNSTVEIRVGPYHPSTGLKFNKLCTRQKLNSLDGNERQLFCENDAAEGRYVSVIIAEPGDHNVSLCEVNVYSDSGLSVADACPPKSAMVPETARYVFENQCVQFLGQNTHANAIHLCELHGGALVNPTSRAFQSFIDFHVLEFFETSFEQVLVSFWVDAKRKTGSDAWVNSSGTALRGVQIRAHNEGKCLVSESRSWHSELCGKQHQVICVSAPLTCGSPALPAFSSIRERVRLPVNKSMVFNCEPGFSANVDRITCFPNGSLSRQASCTTSKAAGMSLSSKISNFLRSFSVFGKLSAQAFRVVLAVLGGVLTTLLSALSVCCFCVFQRRRAKSVSEKIQLSLMSFSVHMRDLPINTSNPLFKAPSTDEKKSQLSPR